MTGYQTHGSQSTAHVLGDAGTHRVGGLPMSLVRKFTVVVVTLLLASTLVTGNLLAAAHLTVLDPGFTQTTIEEEGGYQLVENATVATASGQVSDGVAEGVDTEALLREGIDRPYLANQTERNVAATYAYLHGNSETLNLTVDTVPLKSGLSAAVEQQVRNATVPELLAQSETELDGPVDESTVEQMTANESGYAAAKADFRDEVRDRVLDEAVERAWQNTSNDEKLALVIPDYDPREYTEDEKEQLVADNETEIRAALRERIESERGDEIDGEVDAQLAEINESVAPSDADSDGLDAATTDMRATFAEALTTDMSYQTFQSEIDGHKAAAAAAVGDRTEAQLDEQLPDTLDLTEDMEPATRQSLEDAQTAVTWLDRLVFVLPLVGLALVGLLYYATRSVQTVAGSLGVSLVIAGLPIYLALGPLQSFVERSVTRQIAAGGEASAEPMVELFLGIVGQLFGRVGTVSLAFALAGGVVVAAWLLFRYDVIGGGDERTAAEAAAAADAEAMAQTESETSESTAAEEPTATGETDEASSATTDE